VCNRGISLDDDKHTDQIPKHRSLRMAKYNELLIEYSEEIKAIKALKVKETELSQELEQAYMTGKDTINAEE
jgi:hypothetical protein